MRFVAAIDPKNCLLGSWLRSRPKLYQVSLFEIRLILNSLGARTSASGHSRRLGPPGPTFRRSRVRRSVSPHLDKDVPQRTALASRGRRPDRTEGCDEGRQDWAGSLAKL